LGREGGGVVYKVARGGGGKLVYAQWGRKANFGGGDRDGGACRGKN